MVTLFEGAEEEGLSAGFVDSLEGVVRSLGELFAQVLLVFVVAEEGLEVGYGTEFGPVSRCCGVLGLEGGG